MGYRCTDLAPGQPSQRVLQDQGLESDFLVVSNLLCCWEAVKQKRCGVLGVYNVYNPKP